MNFTDLRLKIRHFGRKNRKILIIVIIIWGIVVGINFMLKHRVIKPEAKTTYEPHVSVMKNTSSTPKNMQEPIENLIEQFVDSCNEGNYQKAFNLLSKDCREYTFENNVEKFMEHVLVKMPVPKQYSIQSYSDVMVGSKKIYIYEIKYIDDILATGLTDSEYIYSNEKMSFYRDEENNIQMSVGNYIYHTPVQSISENEYLKIDVIDKVVNYSIETYQIKFTNRSEYTIVVSDGYGTNEVVLQLNQEVRKRNEEQEIVLKPGESLTQTFTFPKFVDDGDSSNSIIFGAIRVMEIYSGVENISEDIIQSEIDNSIAKFSMNVSITK